MAAPRSQKLRRRYSIGEWYGVNIEKLAPHLQDGNVILVIDDIAEEVRRSACLE